MTTTAKIPTRGSEYAAGYDLYADITKELVIEPHETAKIGTGLSIEIPDGYFGAVFARSGLAAKQALRPANCVGVCDSDYRGEYIVALHNDGTQARTINPGDRIAQLVVMPYLAVEFNEVSELSDTKRGAGGFGAFGHFSEPPGLPGSGRGEAASAHLLRWAVFRQDICGAGAYDGGERPEAP